MKKSFFVVLTLFIFTSVISLAQTKVPDPATFPLSARALGLGKAFVGQVDDVGALYSNPAGIAAITKWQSCLLYGDLPNDYRYLTIATAYPTDYGIFSAGLTASGQSGNYDNKAAILAYSVELKRFMAGISYKDHGGGVGKELDLGLIFKLNRWLTFGTAIQKSIEMTGHPAVWKNGAVVNLLGQKNSLKELAGQDLKLYFAQDSFPTIKDQTPISYSGIEWQPMKILALRAGFDQNLRTYGVGVELGGYNFDYAAYFRDNITGAINNVFSISFQTEILSSKGEDKRINFQDAARQRRMFVPRY
ncbi:MAG: hypothetical protein ABIH50_01645 [bacterium]